MGIFWELCIVHFGSLRQCCRVMDGEREEPVPASSNLWVFLADIVNASASLALLSILNYITRAVLNMAS